MKAGDNVPLSIEYNTPLTEENFTDHRSYEAFLCGEAADIGGGTITTEEIDIIKEHPELTRISVAGLHQDTFEYFIEKYARQFSGIYFFKNKMVSDLSALETLENIEAIGYFANQRAERLWDMSKNKALKMLDLSALTRLHDLSGIEKAPNLRHLRFDGGVWSKSKIDIVPDLAASPLEYVAFDAKMSYQNAYRFLKLPNLKNLNFSLSPCKTEFLAWVSANYPDAVEDSGCSARFQKMKQQFKGMPFEEILKLIQE